MALEPALVIERLTNGNAIEPGLQGTALPKTANTAKRFQENFLGAVCGVGHIPEHAQNQVIDRAVVVRNQPVEGRFRSGLKLGDELGLIAAPREGTGPIGPCWPFPLASQVRALPSPHA